MAWRTLMSFTARSEKSGAFLTGRTTRKGSRSPREDGFSAEEIACLFRVMDHFNERSVDGCRRANLSTQRYDFTIEVINFVCTVTEDALECRRKDGFVTKGVENLSSKRTPAQPVGNEGSRYQEEPWHFWE